MTRRWPAWAVRVVIFGGLAMLLAISGSGRVRADRALHRADEVARRGTPGDVAARAQEAVSVWAGATAVVIKVDRERGYWRATAVAGTACYEVAVDVRVSAHPGLVPCPPVTVAATDDDQLVGSDPRRTVAEGFVVAWLTGDPTADRYVAPDRAAFAPVSARAVDVRVTGTSGDPASDAPGTRSLVNVAASVTFSDRVESLAWTVALVRGDTRWSVDQVAGGEVPSGDHIDLTRGRQDPPVDPVVVR